MEQKNTLMGVLSYLGPFVIIPLATAREDAFVKFHIKQGLVLLIIELIVYAAGMLLWQFWMFYQIINLGIFILAILGIVNAVQGQEKELPLVGQFGAGLKM